AANDLGQLLGKVLDGALDHPSRLGRALGKQCVELLFRYLVGRLIAERIFAELAQRLPPLVEQLPEGPFARLVADEAVLVLDLEVVGIDLDAGQHRGTVRRQGGLFGFLGHAPSQAPCARIVPARASRAFAMAVSQARTSAGPVKSALPLKCSPATRSPLPPQRT